MRRSARLPLAAVILVVALLGPGCGGDASQSRDSTGSAAELSKDGGSLPLTPDRETDPVLHGGDAADDPAIWINRANPARSAIVGTDKDGGLAVYGLSGRQISYRADGDMNNVDVRDGFRLAGRTVALVTAGNRSDNTIAIYRIDARTRSLHDVAARKVKPGVETYGSCMYVSPRSGKVYYFVTSKSGIVEQWELFDKGSGRVDARKARSFKVGSVTEGCVADDELALLYVSEESKGVWRFGAEPDAKDRGVLIDSTGRGGKLTADVEGLTIAYGPRRTGYLIASSQGDSSFAVYRRGKGNRYVTKFKIGSGDGIDAVEGTDGIDVTTVDLGPPFRRGLLVVQDDRNDSGNQNFKLVPWRAP